MIYDKCQNFYFKHFLKIIEPNAYAWGVGTDVYCAHPYKKRYITTSFLLASGKLMFRSTTVIWIRIIYIYIYYFVSRITIGGVRRFTGKKILNDGPLITRNRDRCAVGYTYIIHVRLRKRRRKKTVFFFRSLLSTV